MSNSLRHAPAALLEMCPKRVQLLAVWNELLQQNEYLLPADGLSSRMAGLVPGALMLDFTALAIRNPQKAADMFTEDGAFEMPYLSTFGYATEYKGREAIAGFFRFVRDLYPDFEFENVQVLIDTPNRSSPNTSSLLCRPKRDDKYINTFLAGWSRRMARSSC